MAALLLSACEVFSMVPAALFPLARQWELFLATFLGGLWKGSLEYADFVKLQHSDEQKLQSGVKGYSKQSAGFFCIVDSS